MTHDKLVRQLEAEVHELKDKEKALVLWLETQRKVSTSAIAYKAYTHVQNYIAGEIK